MDLFGKKFWLILIGITVIESLSFFGFLFPMFDRLFFLVILIATMLLSLKKFEYGIYILLTELAIGSKGYLFSLDIGGSAISIRMGIFLIIISTWIWQRIKNNDYILRKNKMIASYLLLFIFIVIGLCIGIKNNNPANVFFDFNAWIFFGLIFSLSDIVQNKKFQDNSVKLLLSASTYLAIKTIVALALFSQMIIKIDGQFYRWIRDTGVGEITYISGNTFRIFFQSQFYSLIALLLTLSILIIQWKNLKKIQKKYLLVIFYLTSLAIIISQSRSFWLAGLAGIISVFILAGWKFEIKVKEISIWILTIIIIVISQLFLIKIITADFSNLINNRLKNLQSEPANLSRLNQLKPLSDNIYQHTIIGSGFGKTATYQSTDPRILASHPGGTYTTYAFEWGYLDIWLKIGLLGLLAYLLLIYKIFKIGLKKITANPLLVGFLAGLVMALTANIFSPYLNHPLGIGYIMLTSVLVANEYAQ